MLLVRLPSKYHKDSWKNYEKVLMVRTQLCIFSNILLNVVVLIAGAENWQLAHTYIYEEGGPPNVELAKAMYPTVKGL